MKQFIYADNAATTQLDSDAFEAMKPYLLSEYGNASQPYAPKYSMNKYEFYRPFFAAASESS